MIDFFIYLFDVWKIPQIALQQKYFLRENASRLWPLKCEHCIKSCGMSLNLSTCSLVSP